MPILNSKFMTLDPGTMVRLDETWRLAKVLIFEPQFVPYISWDAVEQDRRQLACDVRVSSLPDGGVQIVFGWPHANEVEIHT